MKDKIKEIILGLLIASILIFICFFLDIHWYYDLNFSWQGLWKWMGRG